MGRLSSLPTSRLGLGGAPLGNLYEVVSDADARATVDAAWEVGIRYFDTAPLYGHGLSERRLGDALRARPRDEYVISTKVGRRLVPGPAATGIFVNVPDVRPVFDYSADGVRRSLEESLGRLGLERVDVALVHDPDDHEADALAGAFPALVALRDEGVVRAIGAGMNQAEMLARFVERVDVDCVLLAGRYTLMEQGALPVLLEQCTERSVDVIAGGVFNSGILADPGREDITYEYWPASERDVERARRLEATCARHRVALRAAALALPAAHPAIAVVLAGARSAPEIRDNAAAARDPIPTALWDDLITEGLLDPTAPVPAAPAQARGDPSR